MKKKLIIVLTLLFIVTLYLLIHHTYKKSHTLPRPQHHHAWLIQYPQLGKISKQVGSISKTQLNESESDLIGIITNKFGIRDDVLEYIVQSIPENNTLALKAAIRNAQDDQLIYYGDLTPAEVKKIDSNDVLAMWCLTRYISLTKSNKFFTGYDNLFRNTKARDKHMWYIDRKYFSWKVSSSGMSTAAENQACDAGNF